MIKALLVDDEPLAIKTLTLMLEKYCPEVEVFGSSNNIDDAYQKVLEDNPDLIFLDVNMPKGSGLDLLKKISFMNPKVIFTTAYHEYAIEALRQSALDYLLKPINKEELRSSVHRYLQNRAKNQNYGEAVRLLQKQEHNRISISTVDGIHLLDINSIYYIESSKNYSIFHTDTGELISSRPLGEYQKELKDQGFFRIHRSALVNLNHIVKYKKGKKPMVHLKNGVELEVSRSRKEELLQILS